jgi:hypothetical protein
VTSVVYTFGAPIRVVYFSEDVPASNGVRLAAAVLWRGAPAPRPGGWRGLLRTLRYRLGPLGSGFHLKGGGGWSGTAGGQGEQMTLYHSERRVVRVLGRDYPLPPDGGTLVLLVEEGTVGGPAISIRKVTVPVQPLGHIDEDGSYTVWNSVLRSDPEVRTFMAEWPDDATPHPSPNTSAK